MILQSLKLFRYPKFLDVNPKPGQFDSGTMWTNPQFMDGPGDTKRLFYGAYQQWEADTDPADGNHPGQYVINPHQFTALLGHVL